MIKALIFDINGTVTDIFTDESKDEVYRILSNLLDYQGIQLSPEKVRDLFWELNKRQRRESLEEYPEFDAAAIFREIIDTYATEYTRSLSLEKWAELPGFLAEVFRAATRCKLELYSGVREVLEYLAPRYRLAAISDGQSLWAVPELNSVGLLDYFHPLLVSSDFGYRKPDMRLYQEVLDELDVKADEVLFIGNDMYRDVWGPNQLGIKTVFFKSNQGDQKSRGVDPDYVIYRFTELPEAIRFLEEKSKR